MAADDALTHEGARTGNLGAVQLPELLTSLAAAESRGILHLSGGFSSIVCFHEGGIYLAHAETGPSLRQVFLDAAVVGEEQWARAVEATRQGGSLTEALLSVGEASPDRLRGALHEHTINTLFELLVPTTDHYRFGSDETHQLGATFVFDVDEVLDAATARMTDFAEIARSVPSTAEVVAVAPRLPPGVADLTVSALEWQVLATIQGPTPVSDVIAAVGQSAFTVFGALHKLLQSGAIERTEGP